MALERYQEHEFVLLGVMAVALRCYQTQSHSTPLGAGWRRSCEKSEPKRDVSLLRWLLEMTVADSSAIERIVRTSDVNWTIAGPRNERNDQKILARGARNT